MDAEDASCLPVEGNFDDNKSLAWKNGYRIIDLCEFARHMRCKKCTGLLDLNNIQNETHFGLASVLSVLCHHCHAMNDVCTGKAQTTGEGKAMFEVNIKIAVNRVLNDAGAQHVINFLAVLGIPVPGQDEAFMVMPSSPGDGTAPLQTSVAMATAPPSAATQALLTSMTPVSWHGMNPSGPTHSGHSPDGLMIDLDRIKNERGEDMPGCSTKPIHYKPSSGHANRKTYPSSFASKRSTGNGKVTKTKNDTPASLDWKTEESAVVEDDGGDDQLVMELEMTRERKYYRCPLCPRVLPSRRGFNIHVGRKHQASQYQAEHYELGPNAGYTGSKAQDAVGEDAVPTPCEGSDPPDPTQPLSTPTLPPPQEQDADPSSQSVRQDTPSSASAPCKEEQDEKDDTESTPADDATSDRESSDVAVVTRSRRCSAKKGKTGGVDPGGSKRVCRIGNCGKRFSTDSLYQKHLQRVHGLDSPFVCTHCGQEYNSQKSLNVHTTVAHRTKEEREVVCKYCGETQRHARALKKHITAEHPKGSKMTYYCDVCPMTFNLPSALKTHKLKHSGVKNYKCFFCDKRFIGSGNRLSHIRNMHEKDRPFLCDTCGASFNRAHLLREHERVHSGEKPFQCERCAERFRKKEYLTVHMRTHTGERPYKCELCNKAFTQRCSRTLHRRKIHGIQKKVPVGSSVPALPLVPDGRQLQF